MIRSASAALAFMTASAQAETRTDRLGAVFCETLPSFRSLVAAMLARDEAAAASLDDCTFLKPAVHVRVLANLAELGPGSRIVRIRVFGNGASVDGYTLSNDLEDATLEGP